MSRNWAFQRGLLPRAEQLLRLPVGAGVASSLLAAAVLVAPEWAQHADPPGTLFTSVTAFDGVNDKLIKNANVVVTGNEITTVSTEPLAVAGGRVIDGGRRTVIPGMIEVHGHLICASAT